MPLKKQFAALPYLQTERGISFCLITSRDTGRWIVPKGWPQKGLAPHELAEREAFEEAGLVGQIDTSTVGRFQYLKRRDDGSRVACEVGVFALLVRYQAIDWPEKNQRTGLWLTREKAAALVDDTGLAALIQDFMPTSRQDRELAHPGR